MLNVSQKELAEFRNSGKKILKTVTLKTAQNPPRLWYKYKNPAVQAFNYSVISFCKILPPCEFKNSLYRLIGVKIGKDVSIAPDCILDTIFPELIRLDDSVIIGWGTVLYAHEFTQSTVRIGTIHFQKKSMLGEGSVVRPGITVGENSLIGAMSFVNRDVPKNFVEGGVPIHIIRRLKKI